MRMIKFRGKRLNDREWVYGSLFKHDKVDLAVIVNIDNIDSSTIVKNTTSVDPNTIGQFTGLYDKNGEEIYEGDVVKFANPKYGDELFRIGYEDSHIGAFCLCEAGEEDTSRFVAIFGRSDYEPFYCEVIGNIHDNPDLMKGGEE